MSEKALPDREKKSEEHECNCTDDNPEACAIDTFDLDEHEEGDICECPCHDKFWDEI